MTVEERIKMIDSKAERDKQKESEKKMTLDTRRQTAYEKIRELKPRIYNLIKIGNHARENGIKMNHALGCKESYETGFFYSNGWSHLLGFIDDMPIKYIGIVAGGACGDIDLVTDGDIVVGRSHSNHDIVQEPTLYYMERMIKEFDEFENAFYSYIDKICKE